MSDVSKTNELIAELRRSPSIDVQTVIDLMAQAADALESATRVPVQGEPNDDREAAEVEATKRWGTFANSDTRQGAFERDAFIEGYMARATVPDAATEELLRIARRDASRFEDEAVDAIAERDAALAECRTLRGERNTFEDDLAKEIDRANAALAAVERVRAVCAEQAEVRKFNLKIPFESSHLWKKEPNVNDVLAALDGAPEPDPYDDFCPTCDAPNPGHTETCEVPFRSPDSALDGALEPDVREEFPETVAFIRENAAALGLPVVGESKP